MVPPTVAEYLSALKSTLVSWSAWILIVSPNTLAVVTVSGEPKMTPPSMSMRLEYSASAHVALLASSLKNLKQSMYPFHQRSCD
jgi:hypothetical protein